MFLFLVLFLFFYAAYFYLSYQVVQLNDLNAIFSQTASKAQEDLKDYSDRLLEDLGKCYVTVLLLILLAIVITFLWILLLKYNAKIIIWLSLLSLPILLLIGLYYSITTYISLKNNTANSATSYLGIDNSNEDVLNNSPEQTLAFEKALQTILTAELMSYVKNETLWLSLSIILFIVLIVLFIIMHSLRERVSLSIALIRQASKAINGVKSTLIFPILPRTIGIVVLVFGILVSLLIISASHPTYRIVGGPNYGEPCHPRWFNRTNQAAIPQKRLANRTINNRNITPQPQPIGQSQDKPQRTQIRFPDSVNFASGRIAGNSVTQPLDSSHSRSNNQQVASGQSASTTVNNNNINVKPQCVGTQGLSRQHTWKYHALNVFATLWLLHFISGISQTTLAGAFASYYWAYRKPKDVPFFAVTASFFRVLRYHLGDIAFGSFLIATIRYIRIMIEFIGNRLRGKAGTNNNNGVARSATCFFRVFFWLLDRFLKYIDRNAYIMMSMYGEGYLQSAKRAVELLYKNSTKALVLDYVTYFVLLVSRLLITGLTGFITGQEVFTADLHYKWLPVVLVVIGTYFISKGLFSVYSMAVDTLFICFLIDSTNNDGSAEKPYFMSKDLRRIMKRNTVIP